MTFAMCQQLCDLYAGEPHYSIHDGVILCGCFGKQLLMVDNEGVKKILEKLKTCAVCRKPTLGGAVVREPEPLLPPPESRGSALLRVPAAKLLRPIVASLVGSDGKRRTKSADATYKKFELASRRKVMKAEVDRDSREGTAVGNINGSSCGQCEGARDGGESKECAQSADNDDDNWEMELFGSVSPRSNVGEDYS